jgi:hypothetical protein
MRDEEPRRRSRSPRRNNNPERGDNRQRRHNQGGGGGFKWKEKRRDGAGSADGGEKRLERGYRKRSLSPKRNSNKAAASVEDKFGVADKFGVEDKFGTPKKIDSENTDKPPKRAPASASTAPVGEPMIIVHVNDRLGTKAAIPCLASDPIKLFKAQVAARIGREPHEILLKRQGERPFKDQLTLEDYGVSNGVQLDLEVDTGD